jgi:nitrogen fixation protein FixH
MLSGMGVLVSIAVNDPHFALEPDYYDKAVHWDRARAEARASQALGLQLTVSPTLQRGPGGSVELELVVTDRASIAFTGATVELEAFPNAYRNRTQRVSLLEAAPGIYRGKLEGGELGLWELRFAVSRGAERFHEALRRDVRRGGAA